MQTRKSIFVSFAVLALLTFQGCKGGDKDGAKTVAKVGDRVITVTQYNEAVKRLMPEGSREEEGFSELKKDAIAALIEEELILVESGRLGITVSDSELASEIEIIKNEYGGDPFKDGLSERYGDPDAWKEEIRRKLLMKKTMDEGLGTTVEVTEDEIRRYYDEHRADYDSPVAVRASHIVVAREDEAIEIRKKLDKAGFANVARKVSLGPEAKDGGDLGYFGKGEMPEEFEQAVSRLKPGEISPVIKTGYGFHIFMVTARKKGGRVSYKEARDVVRERLRSEKAAQELTSWLSGLKQRTKIEVDEGLL